MSEIQCAIIDYLTETQLFIKTSSGMVFKYVYIFPPINYKQFFGVYTHTSDVQSVLHQPLKYQSIM